MKLDSQLVLLLHICMYTNYDLCLLIWRDTILVRLKHCYTIVLSLLSPGLGLDPDPNSVQIFTYNPI